MSTAALFREPIRLSCRGCDREDADGVYEIPDGWSEVLKDDTHEGQEGKWWTHSGVCPDCCSAEPERRD